ncbi:3-ketoacyl-CoA synthase 10, partial [Nymphaea thermarum]
FYHMTWQNACAQEPHRLPRLQEAQETIHHEQIESKEKHIEVRRNNMEDIEENEEHIQLVSVKEELKHLPSVVWQCSHPQAEPTKRGKLPDHI